MYRKLILQFASLFFSFSLLSQNSVRLYENCSYSGRYYTLEPGNYRLYQMKIGNDKLSSMRIPSNMKVTIYEHDGFKGKSKTYYNDISCLETGWNDMASSVVVENEYNQPGYNEYVTFYQDCHSKGFSLKLGPGSYTGTQLGNLRYNISSFIITGNLQIKAYINSTSLSGYSVVYDQNTTCLPSSQNDKIGSLVIEQKPYNNPGGGAGGYDDYVVMFADCNYEGNGLMLQPGYYRGTQLGLMRYNIASIQVPPGLKVRAYINNENLSGQSYTITENMSCMNSNLKNRIGSLVIERSDYWNNNNNNNNYPGNGGVIIYEDEDFKGRSAALLPGQYSNMRQAGFIDNALSSLILPQGYRVVLYEEENFRGNSYTIYRTKSKFYLSGWSDKTSSIIVYKD